MLKKGDNIIVYGELTTREYETKEGEKRSADEIRVETIGKDLTFHGQAYQQNDASAANQQGQGWGGNQPNDSWATPAAANNGGGWGNGPVNEPPF
jgi:single-strand DNA-binding protein